MHAFIKKEFFTDPSVLRLPAGARFVLLYLLANANSVGAYTIDPETMTTALGMEWGEVASHLAALARPKRPAKDLDVLAQALGRPVAKPDPATTEGFIEIHGDRLLVLNFIAHNLPTGPRSGMATSVAKAAANEIPEIRNALMNRYSWIFERLTHQPSSVPQTPRKNTPGEVRGRSGGGPQEVPGSSGGHKERKGEGKEDRGSGGKDERAVWDPDYPHLDYVSAQALVDHLRAESGLDVRITPESVRMAAMRLADVDGDMEGAQLTVSRRCAELKGFENGKWRRLMTAASVFDAEKFMSAYALRHENTGRRPVTMEDLC